MSNFIAKTKVKFILGLVIITIVSSCFYVYTMYTKEKESIISKVDFMETEEIGLSEDLMNLVIAYEADRVAVNRIVDADDNIVTVPTIGKYTVIYEAVRSGKVTEFKKVVTFIDDGVPS